MSDPTNPGLIQIKHETVSHHIHVNVHEMNENTGSELVRTGFFFDPFIPLKGSYAPPIHYTFECSNRKQTREMWVSGLRILADDESFRGYIESETLSGRFSIGYKEIKQFRDNWKFPLPQFRLVDVPPEAHKRADLHAKRPKNTPRDNLDEWLTKSGFYEVRTPRNRIYTLQSETVEDAKRIFFVLRNYFSRTGGVSQLNFEIVARLVRIPNNFEMAKMLPKGGSANLDLQASQINV